jgi:hypothetical protein
MVNNWYAARDGFRALFSSDLIFLLRCQFQDLQTQKNGGAEAPPP